MIKLAPFGLMCDRIGSSHGFAGPCRADPNTRGGALEHQSILIQSGRFVVGLLTVGYFHNKAHLV
jgi:hypothetical protein